MTPYYEENGIQIYHGNCLDILSRLSSVDLLLTDPPYGTVDGKGKVHKQGSRLVEFNPGEWDKELPLDWIPAAVNTLKDGGWATVFTDKLSVKTVWGALEAAGMRGKQTYYWIKTNPPPQPRQNFCSGVETAVCATKGAVKNWNGGGWEVNYYQEPLVTSNKRTAHPTQKPINLMIRLINVLSKPGQIVLDPFMGSGTTLEAAKKADRQAIGIELSERYCEIAARRLQQGVLSFTA